MSNHDKVLELHEEKIKVLRRLEKDEDFLEEIHLEIDRIVEGMEDKQAQKINLELDIDLLEREITRKQRELEDLKEQLHKFES